MPTIKWDDICKTYEKATPGPWDVWGDVADVDRGYVDSNDHRAVCCCITGEDEDIGAVQLDEDLENAKSIAFSRTALPALTKAVKLLLEHSTGQELNGIIWALQEAGIEVGKPGAIS